MIFLPLHKYPCNMPKQQQMPCCVPRVCCVWSVLCLYTFVWGYLLNNLFVFLVLFKVNLQLNVISFFFLFNYKRLSLILPNFLFGILDWRGSVKMGLAFRTQILGCVMCIQQPRFSGRPSPGVVALPEPEATLILPFQHDHCCSIESRTVLRFLSKSEVLYRSHLPQE